MYASLKNFDSLSQTARFAKQMRDSSGGFRIRLKLRLDRQADCGAKARRATTQADLEANGLAIQNLFLGGLDKRAMWGNVES
jgi:hypothetical protein